MKVTTVIVAVVGLVAILVPQANARSVLVDRVTSALKGSFDSLNSKRNEWFDNYSTINNRTKTSTTNLRELLKVSKMALPLMWYVYSGTVRKQKKNYQKVMNEGPQSLPFHGSIRNPPLGFNLYLEATLLLHQHRDFQVQILKGTKEIFSLTFNFQERRAVISHKEQAEVIEEAVLADDHFPDITLHQPFRINVQVMDDCIVASIWLTNLHLAKPMPLPEKHIWCTRDYSVAMEYSVNIHPVDGHVMPSSGEDEQHDQGSQEEQQHQASQEYQDHQEEYASQESHEQENNPDGHEEEVSDLNLISAVVYSGFILQ